MPDYLEETLDNAQALLDQVKRLERGLSWSALERTEDVTLTVRADVSQGERDDRRGAVEEGGTPLPKGQRPSEEQPGAERPVSGQEDGEWKAPQRVQTPLEEVRETSPLLGQLERLERASARVVPGDIGDRAGPAPRPEGPALPGKGQAFPDTAGAGGEDWSVGRNPAGPSPQAEELRWAERADRVFRRDSRRYDGGFYLY